jgi:hypothetical protein
MKNFTILFLIVAGTILASSIKWESDLVFSHKFHAEEAEAVCSDCHAKALESVTGKDDLLPAMETCYSCHDEDMACESCHLQGEDPILLPRIETYSEKFNHKIHAENNIGCEDCHTDVVKKENVNSGLILPIMDDCMSCHETPSELSGCYSCHTEQENLIPQDHTSLWLKNHGLFSESNENCQSCHVESYCIDCHQGENTMAQSHPADFIITHGMSFLVKESDCESCHQSVDYCIECHVQINYVVPVNHRMEDWRGYKHAEEARMNFETCSVCHVPGEESCSECHN